MKVEYKNYVNIDYNTKLEKEILHLGNHRLRFRCIQRLCLRNYNEEYLETWAIYFEIVDNKDRINGSDIFNYYKVVISFDSWYVPEDIILKDFCSTISKEIDIPISNFEELSAAFNLRRFFYFD